MGFRIDGSDYEIPEFDTFTMGEAVILYELTKLSLDDFALNEDDPKQREALAKNVLHPGTVKTRMIVALLRGNQDMSREGAEQLVDGSNWLETYLQYTERFKSDAAPLANGNAAEDARTESSSDPSGGTSPEDLAAREDPRVSTGTSE